MCVCVCVCVVSQDRKEQERAAQLSEIKLKLIRVEQECTAQVALAMEEVYILCHNFLYYGVTTLSTMTSVFDLL